MDTGMWRVLKKAHVAVTSERTQTRDEKGGKSGARLCRNLYHEGCDLISILKNLPGC